MFCLQSFKNFVIAITWLGSNAFGVIYDIVLSFPFSKGSHTNIPPAPSGCNADNLKIFIISLSSVKNDVALRLNQHLYHV